MDEASKVKIVGHFVGDTLGIRRESPDGSDIALTQPAQLLTPHGEDRFRERHRRTLARAQLSDGVGNILELPRAEDTRMACQDLLDQGGAGPRHADDKYRCR